MSVLTHVDGSGAARMVDVSEKPATRREAVASAVVEMQPTTLALITSGEMQKGDVLAVARVAGIAAAKRTAELIPLCHPLALESVTVDFAPDPPGRLRIRAVAVLTARTGVEMEALTAAAVAALSVYDMCKAVDRSMTVSELKLERKAGGRSGEYLRPDPAPQMSVTVLYFGGLRALVHDKREERITLSGPHDVAALMDELCARYEGLDGARAHVRVAVNETIQDDGHRLADGDTVALIPPVAGGAAPLCQLTENALELRPLLEAVGGAGQGGIAVFIGTVRDRNDGHRVTRLHYEAYESMVLNRLAEIVAECERSGEGVRVAVAHRIGTLEIGDAAVMVAAAGPHRADAFAACRRCIELLKRHVPIFKREITPDGESWVGLRP